jgi:hypothetical protein
METDIQVLDKSAFTSWARESGGGKTS